MHAHAVVALFTSILAVASAAPAAEAEANPVPVLEARLTQWKASGGCRSDWRNRCYDTCRSEAPSKGCRGSVASSIDSGACSLADRLQLRSHCKCTC
ncbi:hypothetical protein QBC34DRAFT_439754 [Podospora aff. communis PSN243]|uniref:Uncharacterized protein n=1 Tax=Podospora aff. communis PSN243 TaxID=3040156 RepID=A0AAV9GH56_9PEZI|nr:hypothetical protein QBC34DRAFT_439754 [Podospora aff. communis PSN243]